ncbi:MAG TPA: hypothetical protein VF187_00870 [Gemmatimonadales bacterium]
MRPGGWILMLAALAAVWGGTIWCFYLVLTAPKDDHVVPPPASLGG